MPEKKIRFYKILAAAVLTAAAIAILLFKVPFVSEIDREWHGFAAPTGEFTVTVRGEYTDHLLGADFFSGDILFSSPDYDLSVFSLKNVTLSLYGSRFFSFPNGVDAKFSAHLRGGVFRFRHGSLYLTAAAPADDLAEAIRRFRLSRGGTPFAEVPWTVMN